VFWLIFSEAAQIQPMLFSEFGSLGSKVEQNCLFCFETIK
jgi:hypothetical protein